MGDEITIGLETEGLAVGEVMVMPPFPGVMTSPLSGLLMTIPGRGLIETPPITVAFEAGAVMVMGVGVGVEIVIGVEI